jgi:hypothetical protein
MELAAVWGQDGRRDDDDRHCQEPPISRAALRRGRRQHRDGNRLYKDAWLPAEVHDMSVDEMTRIMVGDIVVRSWHRIRAG